MVILEWLCVKTATNIAFYRYLLTVPVNHGNLPKGPFMGNLRFAERAVYSVPPVSEIFQFVRDTPFITYPLLLRTLEYN